MRCPRRNEILPESILRKLLRRRHNLSIALQAECWRALQHRIWTAFIDRWLARQLLVRRQWALVWEKWMSWRTVCTVRIHWKVSLRSWGGNHYLPVRVDNPPKRVRKLWYFVCFISRTLYVGIDLGYQSSLILIIFERLYKKNHPPWSLLLSCSGRRRSDSKTNVIFGSNQVNCYYTYMLYNCIRKNRR